MGGIGTFRNFACVGTLIEERCSVFELVWPTSKRGFDSHGKLLIYGEVAEWFKALVLKTSVGESPP